MCTGCKRQFLIYVMYMRMLYVCVCVSGVILFSCEHQAPRLPRKSHRQSGGDQGTPEGHRRDTGGTPEGHRRDTGGTLEDTGGTLEDTGGTPGRTSDPFAVHQVPRLPRKSHRQSGGDQGTPEGHRRDTGGTPEGHRRDTGGTPEGHRRGTGGAPEGHRRGTGGAPEGHRRDTGGTPEGHRRDTGGTPEGHQRDTGAYIRPLCSAPSPTSATQKPPAERRRPRDTRGTPGRTGTPEGHRRDTGGTPEGHRRDTGAHIQPLCSAPSPTPATQMMFDDIMCGMCVCE